MNDNYIICLSDRRNQLNKGNQGSIKILQSYNETEFKSLSNHLYMCENDTF